MNCDLIYLGHLFTSFLLCEIYKRMTFTPIWACLQIPLQNHGCYLIDWMDVGLLFVAIIAFTHLAMLCARFWIVSAAIYAPFSQKSNLYQALMLAWLAFSSSQRSSVLESWSQPFGVLPLHQTKLLKLCPNVALCTGHSDAVIKKTLLKLPFTETKEASLNCKKQKQKKKQAHRIVPPSPNVTIGTVMGR